MAFNPEFFRTGVSINNQQSSKYYGYRVLSQTQTHPTGYNQVACSTSRWEEAGAGIPDNIKGRAETRISDDEGYIVSRAGGLSTTAGSKLTPTFWRITDMFDDQIVIDAILALPYFSIMLNTPVSTTNRDLLVLQIYQAGFYIWMNHLRPPLNEKLELNFEFDDSNCWASTTATSINDLEQTNSGVLTGTNPGWNAINTGLFGAQLTNGYFPTNNSAFIDIQTTFGLGNECTFEMITATGNQNGNPYTILSVPTGNYIEYTGGGSGGYNFGGVDWGGGIVHYFTSFNQYLARHLLFAGSDSLNTSELYVSGVLTTTGTCSTTMTSWGANSRLFSDGNGNQKMPVGGGCCAFRVWNTMVDATQAEILYLHSKGKYIWDASV